MRISQDRSVLNSLRWELRLAGSLAIIALLIYALFSSASPGKSFVSSEVQFADVSPSGALIVPASCPSSPHYAGECGAGGNGGSTGDSNPPTAPNGNACIIALSPSTIVTGQSAFLGWSSTFTIFGVPFAMTGTISPTVGAVAASGVTTVNPTQTTTYTGVFTPTGAVDGIPQSWLTPVTCSGTLTVLTSNPGAGSCAQVNFCSGSTLYQQQTNCSNTLIQQCAYGCSGGACLGASSPAAFIKAVPALVRVGEQTTVTWSSSNASSCSVSGTNGSSWSGLSGSQTLSITSQTTFTLSCLGLNGQTVTQSARVDIIPIFQEL